MTLLLRPGLFFLLLLVVGPSTAVDVVESTTPSGPDTGGWALLADPPKLDKITEYLPYNVSISLVYNASEAPLFVTPDTVFVVSVATSNEVTVTLSETRFEFTWRDVLEGNNKTLEVVSHVIGYVDLYFTMERRDPGADDQKDYLLLKYSITIIRSSDVVDVIFTM